VALEACQFKRLLAARRTDGQRTKLLSLGYPDLLIDSGTLLQAGCKLDTVPDSSGIAAWTGEIYDTKLALESVGIDLTAIDIRPSRGCETVVDLNSEYVAGVHRFCSENGPYFEKSALYGAFDIILDPGTLEHCFNIGQAFLNVAAMIAPGGTIIHTNPLSCVNHGFVSISPTAYHDFYGQNGFQIVYLGAMAGPVGNRTEAAIHPTRRDQLAPEVWSLVVVKAPQDWNGCAKWPTQSKYLQNPDLKASIPTPAG
jgi:hypothetical protein